MLRTLRIALSSLKQRHLGLVIVLTCLVGLKRLRWKPTIMGSIETLNTKSQE
jgi:hypothetical protein